MIYIYAISDSHKHFSLPIEEYIKRLGKGIHLKCLKPSKKDTQKEIITQESGILLRELQKIHAHTILLDIKADYFSTQKLYRLIEEKRQIYGNIVFVIGGAYGVDERIKDTCNTHISLSAMTFPHGMALMILLEQIYRIRTIKEGKKYHH